MLVDGEIQRHELPGACDVGHRHARGPTSEGCAKSGKLCFLQLSLEVHIKADPVSFQDMRQKHFGIEPCRLHALSGQIIRGQLQYVKQLPSVAGYTHRLAPIPPSSTSHPAHSR